jgi:hypothetical protein
MVMGALLHTGSHCSYRVGTVHRINHCFGRVLFIGSGTVLKQCFVRGECSSTVLKEGEGSPTLVV